MKSKSMFLGVLALAFILPHQAFGEVNPPEKALEQMVTEIHATYQKINDLEARFIQKVEILDFNTPYISKGKLFIKKGKMFWDYQEPSKQQIFVDGGGFLYYVPDHKQVIRSKVGGHSDSHLPLKLLSGRGKLDEDFEISFDIEPPLPGAPAHLRLVPKKKMGLIKIVITLLPAPEVGGLIIEEVVLHEENGNISTSTFEDIKINQGLADGLFVFKIPEGIEVLDAP